MFNNLSVGKKLSIVFSLIIFVALVIGAAGYYGMRQITKASDQLVGEAIPGLRAILTISDAQRGIVAAERGLVDQRITDLQVRAQQYEYIQSQWTRIDKEWKIYESLPRSVEEQAVWQQLSAEWQQWQKSSRLVIQLMKEKDELVRNGAGSDNQQVLTIDARALKASSDTRKTYNIIQPLLDKIITIVQAGTTEVAGNAHQAQQAAQGILVTAMFCGLIISIVTSILLTRHIVAPIKELCALMAQAGDGDFTVHGHITSRDEAGQLVESFNQMIDHLQLLVANSRQTAEGLAAASDQLAASSEEVSSTATEIAQNVATVAREAENGNASVVDISKVLLELSSLIQIAKTHATEAGKDSELMQEAANGGKVTVTEAIERMGHIKGKTLETEKLINTLNSYSDQIGTITDTITQLANQTNLLALNAAIEAARAGEAGRGFAVVAEQVRKLAEQSSQGATEVAALVAKVAQGTEATVAATGQSRAEVEQGVEIVGQVGQALENILRAIDRTVGNTKEIVKVTNDEVATSDRIVKLINTVATGIETTAAHSEEVSAAVQETTATMETISASAQEMMAMAHELTDSVEKFKVN